MKAAKILGKLLGAMAIDPLTRSEEPRPGKVYGVQEGKNVLSVVGVKPMSNPKELAALVRYEDNTYEMVPNTVLTVSAPQASLPSICFFTPKFRLSSASTRRACASPEHVLFEPGSLSA